MSSNKLNFVQSLFPLSQTIINRLFGRVLYTKFLTPLIQRSFFRSRNKLNFVQSLFPLSQTIINRLFGRVLYTKFLTPLILRCFFRVESRLLLHSDKSLITLRWHSLCPRNFGISLRFSLRKICLDTKFLSHPIGWLFIYN